MLLSNLPNIITLTRIFLTPFFVSCLIYEYYHFAFYIFIIAGVSDTLDGILARALKSQSELGRFLDPIADKLLLITSFIVFTYINWIPAWFTITVLSRDVFIVIGWFLMFLIFDLKTVQPSTMGKLSNVLQMFLVAYILFENVLSIDIIENDIIIWTTAGITIMSGLHYIYKGLIYSND